MAHASAVTRTVVSAATLHLTGDEAITLMALLNSVVGSPRLSNVSDIDNITKALLNAGVPDVAALGTINLGD